MAASLLYISIQSAGVEIYGASQHHSLIFVYGIKLSQYFSVFTCESETSPYDLDFASRPKNKI
jgi:hypothetical protein